MRIIAGEKHGLVLKTVKLDGFRPTLGRVRESLFSILTPVISGASVLDLFAGSGALGLEALSRGAKDVLFVDNNQAAVQVIKQNIDKTGYNTRCHIFSGDFTQVGKKVAQGDAFDLVFADPPYSQGYPERIIAHLVEMNLVRLDGIVSLEMEKRETPREVDSRFRLIREKKYGSTIIWILRRNT